MQTTLHAQPQYRVVVDTVIVIPAVNVDITLCFRERESQSDDPEYCPLGQLTLQVNGTDGPPQTLNLGPGADNLNPDPIQELEC